MFQMLHGCRFRTKVKYLVLLFSQAIFACNLASLAHGRTPQPTDVSPLDQRIESGLFREYGESMPKVLTTTNGRRIPFQKKTARPGETAIGVEVAKTSDVVAIDITPCEEYKTVLRFWEPYKETGVGLIPLHQRLPSTGKSDQTIISLSR